MSGGQLSNEPAAYRGDDSESRETGEMCWACKPGQGWGINAALGSPLPDLLLRDDSAAFTKKSNIILVNNIYGTAVDESRAPYYSVGNF